MILNLADHHRSPSIRVDTRIRRPIALLGPSFFVSWTARIAFGRRRPSSLMIESMLATSTTARAFFILTFLLTVVVVNSTTTTAETGGGDKSKKALKPRLFVDFTRITDSGTPYSERLAVADFGAIVDFHRESHLFLVDQADRIAFEKVLRAVFPARKTGPDDSGGRFGVSLLPSHHYTIGYAIKFPPHFHWAAGGMLPGICGGANCYCGIEPENFVVTAGWSPSGHLQIELCSRNSRGEKFARTVTSNYTLPKGEWVDLTLDVRLNEPDLRDGSIGLTVNNTFYDSMQNVTFRSSDTVRIDTFLYSTFFATGDPSKHRRSSHGPLIDVFADFDDITVAKAP